MDAETIQTILDLLNPLHGSLDKQTYDERMKEYYTTPPDREYEVTITERQERDLTQAVCILESRLRDLRPATPPKRTDGYGDPAKGEYNAFLADDGSDIPCD